MWECEQQEEKGLLKKKLVSSQHKVTDANVILSANEGLMYNEDRAGALLHQSRLGSPAEAALQKSAPSHFSKGSSSSAQLCSGGAQPHPETITALSGRITS